MIPYARYIECGTRNQNHVPFLVRKRNYKELSYTQAYIIGLIIGSVLYNLPPLLGLILGR